MRLLRLLGALTDEGRLTDKGERMAKLPMHPRLANMMMVNFGKFARSEKLEKCAVLAAIIEERPKSRETDIRRMLDEILETPNNPASRRICQLALRFQTSSIVPRRSSSPAPRPSQTFSEGAALALAYPDRIARNRGNGTFRMVNGRGAFLPDDDPMARAPYIVCCELDDRAGDA